MTTHTRASWSTYHNDPPPPSPGGDPIPGDDDFED